MEDFERLLFAEAYNKDLKKLLKKAEQDIGVLKSEKEELIYLLKKANSEINTKLDKAAIVTTSAERVLAKRDDLVQQHLRSIEALKLEIKQLRIDRDHLISKVWVKSE